MALTIETISVTPFEQNCRIICSSEGRACVVCDPGGETDLICARVDDTGYKCAAVLLTHAHLDHVGAAADLKTRYGCPIIGPGEGDMSILARLDMQAMSFRLPACPKFTPEFVRDGQVLSYGQGLEFEVLATPGHSPGGVCYYCKDDGFVLSGDTLFAGSVGRTDFPGGSMQTLLESIQVKLYVLPKETRVLPGHGPDSTIADEIAHNPFTNGFV